MSDEKQMINVALTSEFNKKIESAAKRLGVSREKFIEAIVEEGVVPGMMNPPGFEGQTPTVLKLFSQNEFMEYVVQVCVNNELSGNTAKWRAEADKGPPPKVH